jgi:hypothetical protein
MFTRTAEWSILAMVLSCVAAGTAYAKGCSTKSLSGSFGFVEQGTLLPPAAPAPVPFTNSGIVTLDGKGNISGTFTRNAGGSTASGTFSGTYTVNADCTTSVDFTTSTMLHLHQVGTITGDLILQEVHYIYTDAFLVATGAARRMSSGIGFLNDNSQ